MFLIIIVFLIVYFYTTRNHRYWVKRSIKHERPVPLFGNDIQSLLGLKSVTSVTTELYNKYPEEKVVGGFSGNNPYLIIRDPEIVKDILTTDFSSFYPRGLGRDTKKEPLLKNLFHVDGDTWKLLRQRLTSAFTSAKLKNMFPLIVNCADKLNSQGDNIVANGGDCDVRDLMARFTTEFIGACGLGIEMDTINNENSIFRKIGTKIFTRSTKDILLSGIWEIFPEIRSMLNLFSRDLENAFVGIITKVFEQRNFKPSGRNDFVDLLLELAAKGKVVGESIEETNSDGSPKEVEIEMDLLCQIAQVFVFFAAGFETSSSSTSYALHELAFHPDIQERIQKEIDEVLTKYDNKLCYDAIANMKLLDMAYKESLRKFAPLGILNRVCAKKYTISKIGVTIDPGVKIIIPVQALHNDSKYYDNPEKFKPERFEETMKQKYVYLPFGEGPRGCIGSRLGHMQSLAGLATILHRFSVEPSEKTQRKLEVNPRLNIVQGALNGIPLKLTLRKK